MVQWFGRDEDNVRRIFGLPVSPVWSGDNHAIFDSFEPENPHLFIPRHFGVGWDLNLGAIAVKAGWIRPDDSLPDLADHVPSWVKKAIGGGVILGGVAIVAASAAVVSREAAAYKWSLGGIPRRFTSSRRAIIAPVMLSILTAAGRRISAHNSTGDSHRFDLGWQAHRLGSEATTLAILLAQYRSACNSQGRSVAAVLAPVLWPVVTGGVQILCVKTALKQLETELRARANTK